jgi:microcystin-dependent protein
MTNSINNDQPSLVLNQVVVESGIFPNYNGSPTSDPNGIPLGAIRTFATYNAGFNDYPYAQPAQGQTLSIMQQQALFSIFGTFYGGDGRQTFKLPNLAGTVAVGAGSGPSSSVNLGETYGQDSVTLSGLNMPPSLGGGGQPIANDQPSLGVNYMINVGGYGGGVDAPGMIVPFLGTGAPGGYLLAEGQILQISQYVSLYTAIGNTYGGNYSQGTFALPDLRGRTIVGAGGTESVGETIGSDTTTIAQSNMPSPAGADLPIDNAQPSLALNYIVCVEGVYLSQGERLLNDQPYLGEIMAYAGTANNIPAGWVLAEGQSVPIDSNEALFASIGTTYGGDGVENFKLPDLRDRDVVGSGTSPTTGIYHAPGETYGTDSYSLTPSEIPATSFNLGTAVQSTEQVSVLLTPNASFVDYFGSTGTLTIARHGGANANDAFGFANSTGFTVNGAALESGGHTFATFTNANGQLTINFNASSSSALVRDVLWHISYVNQSDAPPGSVTLDYTFALPDGTFTASQTDTITAVNDAPTASIANNFTVAEQQTLDLKNAGLSVADPDGASGSETLTLHVGEGTLHAAVGDSGVTVQSGNDSSDLVLSGTIAQLNALLGAGGASDLTYIDNTNTPTSVALELTIDDNGNTGPGALTGSASATIDVTPCYCPGTLIKTPHGEKAVEKLEIGNKVITMSGLARPIKWIGRRSYGGRFLEGSKEILPVCIKAGALDDNVPRRDLWISPHHAMYLEGVLIEAKDIVNGVSIVQAERVEKVEYFHIELDTHDVILAEGAPSETFVDDDSRGVFHNADEYAALYPGVARPARYCAPRLDSGYEVEAVRRRLAERSGISFERAPKTGGLRAACR